MQVKEWHNMFPPTDNREEEDETKSIFPVIKKKIEDVDRENDFKEGSKLSNYWLSLHERI